MDKLDNIYEQMWQAQRKIDKCLAEALTESIIHKNDSNYTEDELKDIYDIISYGYIKPRIYREDIIYPKSKYFGI